MARKNARTQTKESKQGNALTLCASSASLSKQCIGICSPVTFYIRMAAPKCDTNAQWSDVAVVDWAYHIHVLCMHLRWYRIESIGSRIRLNWFSSAIPIDSFLRRTQYNVTIYFCCNFAWLPRDVRAHGGVHVPLHMPTNKSHKNKRDFWFSK